MEKSDRLRELATWYREFADKAGASAIWERRLLTAEDLERAANEIDCRVRAHGEGRRLPSGEI
jgi:hypothetical protein